MLAARKRVAGREDSGVDSRLLRGERKRRWRAAETAMTVFSSLVLDSTANIIVAGVSDSRNLPASTNAFQKLYAGPLSLPLMFDQLFGDAFLAKLDPTGSKLMWLTYLGGAAVMMFRSRWLWTPPAT